MEFSDPISANSTFCATALCALAFGNRFAVRKPAKRYIQCGIEF